MLEYEKFMKIPEHTSILTVLNKHKQNTRDRIRQLLRTQGEEERLRKSRIIQEKLFATEEFQRARVVLFYASFDGEVETFEMMEQSQGQGKKVALPVIELQSRKIMPVIVEDLHKDLIVGTYNIKEPARNCRRFIDQSEIDLVVVPGLAFDRHNRRLGRGGGYYDRLLRDLSPETPAIGLAFDFQILDDLPHDRDADMAVSRVIAN